MGCDGNGWMHADFVSGRGQEVVLDEPEGHLAGECWRDGWAVRVVSAVCPLSLCVFEA